MIQYSLFEDVAQLGAQLNRLHTPMLQKLNQLKCVSHMGL